MRSGRRNTARRRAGGDIVSPRPKGAATLAAPFGRGEKCSDVTNLVRLPQRRDWVPLRDELLPQKARIAVRQDRLDDRRVVQLLRLVDLVAARHAAGVV